MGRGLPALRVPREMVQGCQVGADGGQGHSGSLNSAVQADAVPGLQRRYWPRSPFTCRHCSEDTPCPLAETRLDDPGRPSNAS